MKKLTTLLITLLLMGCSSAPAQPNRHVMLETTQGNIELEIFEDKAGEIATNFIELVQQGKYDGSIFHRVIPNFMIQGGDFENGNGTGGYSYKGEGTKLDDYFAKDLSNVKGTIVMANSGPNTNGSQFFINTVDNTNLDYDKAPLTSKHAVFGKVVKGLNIAEKISFVERFANDKPVEDVVITKATIVEAVK